MDCWMSLTRGVTEGEAEHLSELSGSTGVAEATAVLRLLSNADRLKVLCHLAVEGELSVGQLLERIDLSPSALSQHLAKLRGEELVSTRKERQTIHYRVARQDVLEILEVLHRLYCKETVRGRGA